MADENLGTGGSGEGNTPAGGNTPSGGGQQPVAGQPGGQPAEKTFSYKEDRTDWVPRTRLNEYGGKLTAAEKRAQEAEAALTQERARVAALAGVSPRDPKAVETDEIRAAIQGMFPELEAIKGFTREQLQEIMQAASTARNTSQASWERHATTMLSTLETDVAKGMGIEKLSDTQKRNLHRSYREEAQIALQQRVAAVKRGERESVETDAQDNDFIARHERGDQALLKEFVTAFLGDWFEPARRQVTAQNARRTMRPVPRGERTRQIPAAGEQKVDLNDKQQFQKALLAARGSGQE